MKWLRFFLNAVFILRISANITFLILHNNDMHSQFDEFNISIGKNLVGGMARTAHLIKEFHKAATSRNGPPVLFLNAGDTFSGTLWFSIYRWKIASDFLNLLRPDAMVLGNHEFDDGLKNLTLFIKSMPIPMLCCNCNVKKEPKFQNMFHSSSVLTLRGIQIGVIGYIYSKTSYIAQCGNITFKDEVTSVTSEVKKLTKQGINIIIVLGHGGFEMDQRIAREVEGVDVVVGGHSHTFLWTGEQPDLERPVDVYPKVIYSYEAIKVPVVQAYSSTKYLGYLEVSFNDKGELQSWKGNPILMDNTVPKDKEVEALVQKYKKRIHDLQNVTIGRTTVRLDHLNCRYEECNFGNLIADAFVSYKADKYIGPYWTDCAIGLVNAGSVQMSINPGKITMVHILEAIPYFNDLISFDISGENLIKALEAGVVSTISEVRGEFLQVSGLKLIINRLKPPSRRIQQVFALCSRCDIPTYFPLENNSFYRVVTNGFLEDGGGGKDFSKGNPGRAKAEGIKDYQAVAQYLKKVQVVNNTIEGRIVFLQEMETADVGNELAGIISNNTISKGGRNLGNLWKNVVVTSYILCLNIYIF